MELNEAGFTVLDAVLHSKDADGMANSVGPDQTASTALDMRGY